MSAKDMARRVELRLKFQNVKVPADINKYLSSLTFTDEDEDNADDLQLGLLPKSIWEAVQNTRRLLLKTILKTLT